jgi:hypothetical protein
MAVARDGMKVFDRRHAFDRLLERHCLALSPGLSLALQFTFFEFAAPLMMAQPSVGCSSVSTCFKLVAHRLRLIAYISTSI